MIVLGAGARRGVHFEEVMDADLIQSAEGEGEVSYLVAPQCVSYGPQSFFF